MERLKNGILLKQEDSFLRIGTDAVLLADFVRPSTPAKICDLGCGVGAISFLLADHFPNVYLDGVDIQDQAVQLARETAELNRLENRLRFYCADFRALSGVLEAGSYTDVVCNPPYYPPNSGKTSSSVTRKMECTEETASIWDVCHAASFLLKNGGNFAVIYPTLQLMALLQTMVQAGIEPKRIRIIHANPQAPSKRCLVAGKRSAKPGWVVEPPLILQTAQG